jgi:hypothetical protein
LRLWQVQKGSLFKRFKLVFAHPVHKPKNHSRTESGMAIYTYIYTHLHLYIYIYIYILFI